MSALFFSLYMTTMPVWNLADDALDAGRMAGRSDLRPRKLPPIDWGDAKVIDDIQPRAGRDVPLNLSQQQKAQNVIDAASEATTKGLGEVKVRFSQLEMPDWSVVPEKMIEAFSKLTPHAVDFTGSVKGLAKTREELIHFGPLKMLIDDVGHAKALKEGGATFQLRYPDYKRTVEGISTNDISLLPSEISSKKADYKQEANFGFGSVDTPKPTQLPSGKGFKAGEATDPAVSAPLSPALSLSEVTTEFSAPKKGVLHAIGVDNSSVGLGGEWTPPSGRNPTMDQAIDDANKFSEGSLHKQFSNAMADQNYNEAREIAEKGYSLSYSVNKPSPASLQWQSEVKKIDNILKRSSSIASGRKPAGFQARGDGITLAQTPSVPPKGSGNVPDVGVEDAVPPKGSGNVSGVGVEDTGVVDRQSNKSSLAKQNERPRTPAENKEDAVPPSVGPVAGGAVTLVEPSVVDAFGTPTSQLSRQRRAPEMETGFPLATGSAVGPAASRKGTSADGPNPKDITQETPKDRTESPESGDELPSRRQGGQEPPSERQGGQEPSERQGGEEPSERQGGEEPRGRQGGEEPRGRQGGEDPPTREKPEDEGNAEKLDQRLGIFGLLSALGLAGKRGSQSGQLGVQTTTAGEIVTKAEKGLDELTLEHKLLKLDSEMKDGFQRAELSRKGKTWTVQSSFLLIAGFTLLFVDRKLGLGFKSELIEFFAETAGEIGESGIDQGQNLWENALPGWDFQYAAFIFIALLFVYSLVRLVVKK